MMMFVVFFFLAFFRAAQGALNNVVDVDVEVRRMRDHIYVDLKDLVPKRGNTVFAAKNNAAQPKRMGSSVAAVGPARFDELFGTAAGTTAGMVDNIPTIPTIHTSSSDAAGESVIPRSFFPFHKFRKSAPQADPHGRAAIADLLAELLGVDSESSARGGRKARRRDSSGTSSTRRRGRRNSQSRSSKSGKKEGGSLGSLLAALLGGGNEFDQAQALFEAGRGADPSAEEKAPTTSGGADSSATKERRRESESQQQEEESREEEPEDGFHVRSHSSLLTAAARAVNIDDVASAEWTVTGQGQWRVAGPSYDVHQLRFLLAGSHQNENRQAWRQQRATFDASERSLERLRGNEVEFEILPETLLGNEETLLGDETLLGKGEGDHVNNIHPPLRFTFGTFGLGAEVKSSASSPSSAGEVLTILPLEVPARGENAVRGGTAGVQLTVSTAEWEQRLATAERVASSRDETPNDAAALEADTAHAADAALLAFLDSLVAADTNGTSGAAAMAVAHARRPAVDNGCYKDAVFDEPRFVHLRNELAREDSELCRRKNSWDSSSGLHSSSGYSSSGYSSWATGINTQPSSTSSTTTQQRLAAVSSLAGVSGAGIVQREGPWERPAFALPPKKPAPSIFDDDTFWRALFGLEDESESGLESATEKNAAAGAAAEESSSESARNASPTEGVESPSVETASVEEVPSVVEDPVTPVEDWGADFWTAAPSPKYAASSTSSASSSSTSTSTLSSPDDFERTRESGRPVNQVFQKQELDKTWLYEYQEDQEYTSPLVGPSGMAGRDGVPADDPATLGNHRLRADPALLQLPDARETLVKSSSLQVVMLIFM